MGNSGNPRHQWQSKKPEKSTGSVAERFKAPVLKTGEILALARVAEVVVGNSRYQASAVTLTTLVPSQYSSAVFPVATPMPLPAGVLSVRVCAVALMKM